MTGSASLSRRGLRGGEGKASLVRGLCMVVIGLLWQIVSVSADCLSPPDNSGSVVILSTGTSRVSAATLKAVILLLVLTATDATQTQEDPHKRRARTN